MGTYIALLYPSREKFDEFRQTLTKRFKRIPKAIKLVSAYIILPCKTDAIVLETSDISLLHEFLIPFVPVCRDMEVSPARTWEEVSKYDFYGDVEDLMSDEWKREWDQFAPIFQERDARIAKEKESIAKKMQAYVVSAKKARRTQKQR